MRRLKIMTHEPEAHFTLWSIGSQQVHVAFDGGRIVSDAGLLAVRALEKPLGVIADLAQRLPDPRSPQVHPARRRGPAHPADLSTSPFNMIFYSYHRNC